MVDDVDAIAEVGDVANRLLDENILVAYEDAADDLGHRSSRERRRCSITSSCRWVRTAYDSPRTAASTSSMPSRLRFSGNRTQSAPSDSETSSRSAIDRSPRET